MSATLSRSRAVLLFARYYYSSGRGRSYRSVEQALEPMPQDVATLPLTTARPRRVLQAIDPNVLPQPGHSSKYGQVAIEECGDEVFFYYLWKRVEEHKHKTSYMRDTASSRSHRSAGDSTAPASVTSRSSRASKPPGKARLRDADFRGRVLVPRGISFPPTTESSNAFAHFGTKMPSGGYDGLDQMRHTNV